MKLNTRCISRQSEEAEKIDKYKNIKIPKDLNISYISGLSNELRQKIERVKPKTIGQASRISGITPAALNILMIHIKKMKLRKVYLKDIFNSSKLSMANYSYNSNINKL